MSDLLKTVDDDSCQLIARAASLFTDFSFCFRYKFNWADDDTFLRTVFEDHAKFIKQLCRCIIPMYYVMEDDVSGLTVWS